MEHILSFWCVILNTCLQMKSNSVWFMVSLLASPLSLSLSLLHILDRTSSTGDIVGTALVTIDSHQTISLSVHTDGTGQLLCASFMHPSHGQWSQIACGYRYWSLLLPKFSESSWFIKRRMMWPDESVSSSFLCGDLVVLVFHGV